MKQLYKLIFILIISVNTLNANNNYGSLAVEKITSGTFVLPTATITASVPAVCINGTPPLVTFTGSGGVAPYTFTYKINGGSNIITSQSTGDILTLNVPTSTIGSFIYTLVSVKDATNATQTQTGSVTINVNALPVVDFTFTNDNSCSGTTVQFNSNVSGSGTYTYAWDFGDGNFSEEENPKHIYTREGTYTIKQTVNYPFGCQYIYTTTLVVEKGYSLVMPNAFTPNNDSFNDSFAPVFLGLINITLDVFDSWGSIIYSESGENIKGWNGKVKDLDAENGNYYFKIISFSIIKKAAPLKKPITAIQLMFLRYQKKSIFSIPITATPAADPIIKQEPPVPAVNASWLTQPKFLLLHTTTAGSALPMK